jgi:hypothetical protein
MDGYGWASALPFPCYRSARPVAFPFPRPGVVPALGFCPNARRGPGAAIKEFVNFGRMSEFHKTNANHADEHFQVPLYNNNLVVRRPSLAAWTDIPCCA